MSIYPWFRWRTTLLDYPAFYWIMYILKNKKKTGGQQHVLRENGSTLPLPAILWREWLKTAVQGEGRWAARAALGRGACARCGWARARRGRRPGERGDVARMRAGFCRVLVLPSGVCGESGLSDTGAAAAAVVASRREWRSAPLALGLAPLPFTCLPPEPGLPAVPPSSHRRWCSAEVPASGP